MRSTGWSLVVLLALGSSVCPPAAATTYIMMSDEDLVDRAPVAVQVKIVAKDPSPAPGLPSTDYMVEVDRVLKGSIPGSTLIVRVPGGIRPGDLGFAVFGAPRFRVGERALLFLSPGGDGAFRIFQLMLGAFHEATLQGRRLALRDFSEGREMEPPGQERSEAERRRARAPRRLEEFASWITDRARGLAREPDYFVPHDAGDLQAQVDRFTLFRDPEDREKIRWFFNMESGPVPWRLHSGGQPGLTLQQLQTAVQRGISAWDRVPEVDVRYRLRGTTEASGGLTFFDGVNTVISGNPNNFPLFGGDFDCATGGVLALGGPWFELDVLPFRGDVFHRTREADIITNRGIQCFFEESADPQAAADELFAHELGHTLAVGHSCGDGLSGSCDTNAKNQALMRAFVHDDARGARLSTDDRDAARFLYRIGAPTSDTPTHLEAVPFSPNQILLLWKDNSNGEEGFVIEASSPEGPFEQVAVAPGGAEQLIIFGLERETPYTFRVRAATPEGFTDYSNEASATTRGVQGPCTSDSQTLCLLDRFQVRVSWRNQRIAGDNGPGRAITVPGSDVTGMFWFFSPANVELIVKMLDAQSVNAFFWTFYGALTDVEYWISVTDTANGESVTYHNPPEDICGLGDVRSFPRVGDPVPIPGGARSFATAGMRVAGGGSLPPEAVSSASPPALTGGGSCVPGPETLCLMGNRFRVEVEWSNPRIEGDEGMAGVVDVPTLASDQTGLLWFFSPDNIELVVKIIDGRPVNGQFWFFWGALSDVAYRITVTDTETGDSRTYENEPFNLCGGADIQAL